MRVPKNKGRACNKEAANSGRRFLKFNPNGKRVFKVNARA